MCDTVLKTVAIARQHATRIHMSVAAKCILCARVYKNEKSFAMHLIRALRDVQHDFTILKLATDMPLNVNKTQLNPLWQGGATVLRRLLVDSIPFFKK